MTVSAPPPMPKISETVFTSRLVRRLVKRQSTHGWRGSQVYIGLPTGRALLNCFGSFDTCALGVHRACACKSPNCRDEFGPLSHSIDHELAPGLGIPHGLKVLIALHTVPPPTRSTSDGRKKEEVAVEVPHV
jgi:hypothetical protein